MKGLFPDNRNGQKMLGLSFLIAILLSGCWGRRELDTMSLVLGIGIDARENQQTLLTFQLVKPAAATGGSQTGSGSRGAETSHVVESQAWNIFDAIRNVTFHHSRRINFTHNLVLIVGEKAAKRGVREYIDLLVRDAETRPTQQVLFTPGEAAEVLKVKPHMETITAMEIQKILTNAGATSKMQPVILQDLMEALLNKTFATTVPLIRIEQREEGKGLIMDGTAVLKGDRWVGTLTPTETRGMLWVTGGVKGGMVALTVPKGGAVSMEIVSASGKFEPELSDRRLKMKVAVQVETNVGSMMTTQKLITPPGLAQLARQTEGVVRNEIKKTLDRAQTLKLDIFGFGGAVYRKYPREWKRLEPVWDDAFSGLEVEIRVKAKVRLVGKNTQPI